ncbi:MAG: hypothetical protein ACLP07_17880 [Terracidiphilus sp.]
MSEKAKPVAKRASVPAAAPVSVTSQPPVSNSRGVDNVYANNVGISATMLDFTLYFIETGQLPGEKGPVVHNDLRAAVTLPLPAAMALMEAVGNMLKNANEMAAKQKAALQAMRKSSAPQ